MTCNDQGLPRATYCNGAKSAVNDWLSQLVTAVAKPNGGTGVDGRKRCVLQTIKMVGHLTHILQYETEDSCGSRLLIVNGNFWITIWTWEFYAFFSAFWFGCDTLHFRSKAMKRIGSCCVQNPQDMMHSGACSWKPGSCRRWDLCCQRRQRVENMENSCRQFLDSERIREPRREYFTRIVLFWVLLLVWLFNLRRERLSQTPVAMLQISPDRFLDECGKVVLSAWWHQDFKILLGCGFNVGKTIVNLVNHTQIYHKWVV